MGAISQLVFLVAVLLGFLLGPSQYSARYELPDGDASLEVTLVHGHPFLAEYSRTVALWRGGKKVSEEELLFDSGGYSRVNLYRISKQRFRLTTLGLDLELDQGRLGLKPPVDPDDEPPPGSAYLGAFDWHGGEWQFVGVSQRAEVAIGELRLND